MSSVESAAPKHECERCNASGHEYFWYMDNRYLFDVDRARAIAGDGREPEEIDEDSLQASIADCGIDEEHVQHVNWRFPGIIAHVYYRSPDGNEVHGHLLIDGNHRATRCLREKRPYFAYILSEEESRAIVLRSPERFEKDFDIDPPAEEEAGAGDLHPQTTRDFESRFQHSLPLWQRGQQVLAGGTSQDQELLDPFEVHIARASGARKWDASGQPLIDMWMGRGALLCGHGYAPVVQAVTQQVQRGTHFGACHELEGRWAEMVCRLIPSAERVRFTESESEAAALAIRMARAYTGKKILLVFDGHQHGWHDETLAHFHPAAAAGLYPGVEDNVVLCSPDDLDEVVSLVRNRDVAAVLLEPGGGSMGGLPCQPWFLAQLRQLTREQGVVLIFDETTTGFRCGPGGIQGMTGIHPDLTVLGKILCGGLPGGAVAGRQEFMAVLGAGVQVGQRRCQVPHGGTFNANPLSAAAGLAMLEQVADGAAQEQARLAANRLVKKVNARARKRRIDVLLDNDNSSIYHILIGAHAACAPLGASPALPHLYATHTRKYALLRRALLVEGLDSHPVHGWVSTAHDTEVIDEAVAAFDRAFARLQNVPGFHR